MDSEWAIRPRAHQCAKSEQPFADGAIIYTLLYRERNGFRREDISEQAWLEIKGQVEPFSFWRSRFEVAPSPPPEPLPKESGEILLRKLMGEDRPEDLNARYVLSLMLERKKIFRPVDIKEKGEEKFLIYEHTRTGEVFIVEDPRLRLDQLDSVQEQVYALLVVQSQVQQPQN